MKPQPPEYLSAGVSSRRLPQPLIKALRTIVNGLAGFTKFNATYAGVIAGGIPDNLAERFLNHIAVGVEINRGGLEWIPRAGPLVVVANHPFGMVDGLMLNAVVTSVRPDYKCLAAYELGKKPGLSRTQFVVDPLKSRKLLGLVITGLLGFVAFAPPLRRINAAATSALVSYFVLAGGAYWIERKRA